MAQGFIRRNRSAVAKRKRTLDSIGQVTRKPMTARKDGRIDLWCNGSLRRSRHIAPERPGSNPGRSTKPNMTHYECLQKQERRADEGFAGGASDVAPCITRQGDEGTRRQVQARLRAVAADGKKNEIDMEVHKTLFDIDDYVAEVSTSRSRLQVFEDYDAFVEKFKPKKTTDDCYTPTAVYDAIIGWLRENVDIEGREIVRPFYPGGDFERFEYPEGCVVVDNPPFSIIAKICRWYMAHNIDFFLFAPHLTLFGCRNIEWTCIVTNAPVIYENGANVTTSFVSSLFGDIRVMTAPKLRRRIVEACKQNRKQNRKQVPKYRYPYNVISPALLGKIAPYVDFVVRADECRFISRLDSQSGGPAIFGGGVLLSNAKAAEKAAAEKAAERECTIWELSDRERRIIAELSKNNE